MDMSRGLLRKIAAVFLCCTVLAGCGENKGKVPDAVSVSKETTVSSVSASKEDTGGKTVSTDNEEASSVREDSDAEVKYPAGFTPVPELEGMEVKGMVYAWRPYKEEYRPFINALVDDRYYVVQSGETFGLMDIDGKWIVKPEYVSVSYAYNYYIYDTYGEESKNYTLMDGALVQLDPETGWADVCGTNVDPGIAWDPKTSGLVIINYQEDEARPTGFDGVVACREYSYTDSIDEYYHIQESENCAVIVNNKPVTDFIYEEATVFSEGLIAVKKDGRWGYADIEGNEVIPCLFDGIRDTQYDYGIEISYYAKEHPDYYTEEEVNGFLSEWEKSFFGAACTEGCVVLSQAGGYALFSDKYEELIPFGEFDNLSEVKDGKLFAEKDGVWGVLSLDEYLAASE